MGWESSAGGWVALLAAACGSHLILHQSMQCSRPACTSPPTLPPSQLPEKMALAKLFALLSLYQLPSPVQSTVLRGGEQISDY